MKAWLMELSSPYLNCSCIPNIFVWNCKGAGSRCFARHFAHYVRKFSPSIVILFETRVPSTFINHILSATYLSSFTVSEATGYAGGIWIMWDPTVVQIDIVSVDDQIVNMVVKSNHNPWWFLLTIYVSLKLNFKSELWKYFIRIGTGLLLPWLITGYFNQILNVKDKRGGKHVTPSRLKALQHMVDSCTLIDLGFCRSQFTWLNIR